MKNKLRICCRCFTRAEPNEYGYVRYLTEWLRDADGNKICSPYNRLIHFVYYFCSDECMSEMSLWTPLGDKGRLYQKNAYIRKPGPAKPNFLENFKPKLKLSIIEKKTYIFHIDYATFKVEARNQEEAEDLFNSCCLYDWGSYTIESDS